MKKEKRLLRVGVLGCGPISQAAHLEASLKARNAELYAVCDLAEDLVPKDSGPIRATKNLYGLRRDAGRPKDRSSRRGYFRPISC